MESDYFRTSYRVENFLFLRGSLKLLVSGSRLNFHQV